MFESGVANLIGADLSRSLSRSPVIPGPCWLRPSLAAQPWCLPTCVPCITCVLPSHGARPTQP